MGEKFKIIVDLHKPQLVWDTEYTMMKQNTNIMYELFYSLVVAGCFYIISLFISTSTMFLISIFVVLSCINIFYKIYVNRNIYRLFKNVY